MLKWSVPGTAHFFVMWAFFILATVYLEAYGSLLKLLFTGGEGPGLGDSIVGHWAVLGFLQDFIAVMALFGLVTFYVIRLRNAPKDLGRRSRFFGSHLGPAYFTLFMIFNVIWTMFLFRGASSALGNLPYDNGAFVSIGIGKLLDGLSHSTLEVLEGIGLLLHIGVMLVFLIFVLNSKHLHIFVAPLNVIFGREPVALGAAKPMMNAGKPLTLDDLEDLDEDAKLGVGAAEDFSWKGILDMATCTECGRCQDQCPAWNTEKPLSPKLMMMALRDHTLSKTPYLLADEGKRETMLEGDEALAKEVERPLIGDTGDDWFYMPEDGSGVIDPDVLWSCVTCGACVQQCPVDIEHVDHIVDMRRYQVLVESNFPAELNGLFKGLENKGNPWNMSSTARLDWAKDLPFDVKVVGEDVESLDEVEWLFWVGCAGAYEDRAKKTTRAVAELLDMAGVSFAVLGNGETCTGDSARRAGNEFVFQSLAAENIATFKETKVKKVVSTCAHCFNTLKNEYSQLGIELEVVHHTQLLNRLVREKKLTPVASRVGGAQAVDHLPRPVLHRSPQRGLPPPRELLNVIPDASFTEMPRNSERSFCCGAGGARMWMEETIGTRINETRTKEAVATGADQIAVGCPFCRVMLSDGLTSAQSKGEAREEVEVLDVAQMLLASVKGESKPVAKQAAAASGGGGSARWGRRHRHRDDRARLHRRGHQGRARGRRHHPDRGDGHQDRGRRPGRQGVRRQLAVRPRRDDSSDDPEEPSRPSPRRSPKPSPSRRRPRPPVVARCSTSAVTTTPPEPEAKAPSPRPRPGAQGRAAAKAESSDTDFGGSLFDLGGDDDSSSEPESKASAPEASEPEEKAGEDAAGDSTTDEDVDRSEDDADTDVEPATAAGRSRSVRHRLHPRHRDPRGRLALRHRGTRRGRGHQGRPGGRDHDRGAGAVEESEDKAGEDAAGDSTTDEDVDRSEDDADTDVEPAEDTARRAGREGARRRTASSGTASTPGTEIPEGGSLFDIEAPAEEEVTQPPRRPRPRPRSRRAAQGVRGQGRRGRSRRLHHRRGRRPQRGRRRHRRRTRGGQAARTQEAELRRRADHLAARHQGEVRRGRLVRLRRLVQRRG